MSKRGDRRKLELKRERLRQLTPLADRDVGQVAGGGDYYYTDGPNGRIDSRCCRNE